jgi:phage shock protein C
MLTKLSSNRLAGRFKLDLKKYKMEKKLYKDEHRKMIAGVCAGLSDYFGTDVSIIRVVFLLMLIFHGGGFLVYVVLWIVLPKKDYTFTKPSDPNTVDYMVPPISSANQYMATPPKSRSNGGLIVGMILIVLGASFLLNEYDIIPDWDFERLWPVVLVVIGAALIFSGQQKKPWEHDNWHKAENKDAPASDNSSNNNPPTV